MSPLVIGIVIVVLLVAVWYIRRDHSDATTSTPAPAGTPSQTKPLIPKPTVVKSPFNVKERQSPAGKISCATGTLGIASANYGPIDAKLVGKPNLVSGTCTAPSVLAKLQPVVAGQTSYTFPGDLNKLLVAKDPCYGEVKHVYGEYTCTS